jgi:hypothetical protein
MTDQVIASLSGPRFDPVDYLNDTLPTVTLSSQTQSTKVSRASHLQSAATDVQTQLSKLNAQSIRSSSELTALTDEILRSGSRLAYEVELLRGDVNSFHDVLSESLKDEIAHFVSTVVTEIEKVNGDPTTDKEEAAIQDPAFIVQLRRLTQVKTRLEAVISLFGEATKWPVPPSEVSGANVLISVSAPELGIQSTEEDDKAREATKKIRSEIQDLLDADGGGSRGLEAATKKVEDYRQLATLWKGTNEERARNRFVDGLAKLADDRRRNLEARGVAARSRTDSPQRSSSTQGRPVRQEGGGLFRGLARLKDDLYLD